MNVLIQAGPVGWQRRYADAAAAGLRRHGVNVLYANGRARRYQHPPPSRPRHQHPNTPKRNNAPSADVTIIMGPNNLHREPTSGDFLVFNRKFVGMGERHVHDNVAISWNGFNGNGTFCVDDIDPNRLNRYIRDEDILDWQDGPNSLLCEQSDIGRSKAYHELKAWYDAVRKYESRKVICRHKRNPEHVGTEQFKNALPNDLKGIGLAHVLNSTFSVELLQYGIPVTSWDIGDPCYPITGRPGEGIYKSEQRREWLNYLAHCQWHIDEITNGDWWDRMKEIRGPKLYECKLG